MSIKYSSGSRLFAPAGPVFGIIFFAILVVADSCSQSTHSACDKFKIGRFRFHSRISGEDYMIDRVDSFQVESLRDGNRIKYLVNWDQECGYKLTYLSQTNKHPDSLEIIFPILEFTILKSAGDYYLFYCKAPDRRIEITDTMWRR